MRNPSISGILYALIAAALLICLSGFETAGENLTEKDMEPSDATVSEFETESAVSRILDDFDWRLRALAFGNIQFLDDSPVNLENFLELPQYQAAFHLRPDLSLSLDKFQFSAKPRLELTWSRFEDGIEESRGEQGFFVNEWTASAMVTDKIFVSCGREVLLWGPSYLLSPSNPFSMENGRDRPQMELPGMDYARCVLIPGMDWSVSLIANTGEGRKDFFGEFQRGYAIKLDYTGYRNYFSLIPAYREPDFLQTGFFGNWSATDALLIYAEGAFEESNGLSLLAGQSYTLETGPTLTAEYYHNASGCTDRIRRCFPPFNDSGIDDPLHRKNYLLLQYLHTGIYGKANWVARWTWGLDDGSGRLANIAEYEKSSHSKLFAVLDFFTGDRDSELGTLLEYSFMIGGEYNF